MGDSYGETIAQLRSEKNDYFWSVDDSPIPIEERGRYKQLNYFPVDPTFKVSARLTKFTSPPIILLATSVGTEQKYLRYGQFNFSIQDTPCKLLVFKSFEHEERESLFVPFRDKTSGKESYPAARYLDIPEEPGSEYTIDFNLAYNPYCAYSEDYVCPLPPPENNLPVEIRAGEMRLHE